MAGQNEGIPKVGDGLCGDLALGKCGVQMCSSSDLSDVLDTGKGKIHIGLSAMVEVTDFDRQ